MKRIAAAAFICVGLFTLTSCNQQIQQGDYNVQYFFSGQVIDAEEEYLRIEVSDTGNSNLSEGTVIEVSTDVVAAAGCPDFAAGDYAKVLTARNVEDGQTDRLDALSIYPLDENDAVVEAVSLHSVQQWSEEYTAGDYFLYANEGSDSIEEATAMSLADYAIPYEETRYFSDDQQQLEAEQVIPEMEQPGFDSYVNYLETGEIYSVNMIWSRSDGRLDSSHLMVTAGYQPVEQIEDCIAIELDENGQIVEPTVTVTERDGVQIVAEGREDRAKTVTFQTEDGWYQITGSADDSYESVIELLDWFWEHPLDFSLFPIESGDAYAYAPMSEYPGVFADCLPDCEKWGLIAEQSDLMLKNGEPVSFAGYYTTDAENNEIEDAVSFNWEVHFLPESKPPFDSDGSLDQLTQQNVADILTEKGWIAFTVEENLVIIYPDTDEHADYIWQLMQSLIQS